MRERVLDRVRRALEGHEPLPRPPGPAPRDDAHGDGVQGGFRRAFEAAGGEVVRLTHPSRTEALRRDLASRFTSVAHGEDVPAELRIDLPEAPPEEAALGVSVASAAAADTGSLILPCQGGRASQLLPPVHVVWIGAERVMASLSLALEAGKEQRGSVLAIHSGPSKSADIGRILVTGVHGPARVMAALVGPADDEAPTGPG